MFNPLLLNLLRKSKNKQALNPNINLKSIRSSFSCAIYGSGMRR